jgi:hypothetical protein
MQAYSRSIPAVDVHIQCYVHLAKYVLQRRHFCVVSHACAVPLFKHTAHFTLQNVHVPCLLVACLCVELVLTSILPLYATVCGVVYNVLLLLLLCTGPVAILWSKQRTMILQQAVEKLMLPSFEAELIQEMRTKYVTSATHTLLLRLQCTSSVLEAYSLVQL